MESITKKLPVGIEQFQMIFNEFIADSISIRGQLKQKEGHLVLEPWQAVVLEAQEK